METTWYQPWYTLRVQVQEVCLLVTTRSASLTAAAIVGILRHLQRSGSQQGASPRDRKDVPRNIVAVDGGIFAHYHIYRHLVGYILYQPFNPSFKPKDPCLGCGQRDFGALSRLLPPSGDSCSQP